MLDLNRSPSALTECRDLVMPLGETIELGDDLKNPPGGE